MNKVKDKRYFGFFGFFALLAVPGLLEGEWVHALWLIWLVWFGYFFKKPESGETDTRRKI